MNPEDDEDDEDDEDYDAAEDLESNSVLFRYDSPLD